MSTVEPFDLFLARTTTARPEEYADALAASGEEVTVAEQEFERMKAYILTFYEGVRPVCSYLDASGHPVDCVPVAQQPTARAAVAAGHPLPPAPPAFPGGEEGRPPAVVRQGAFQEVTCPAGTVPVPRVTLERLLGFGTLENFFRKGPPLPPQ